MSDQPMHCWIYRSRRKDEMYVYLAREDDFEVIPEALRGPIGGLDRVMDLDLGPGRKLARADVGRVRQALRDQGFYVQMPPDPLKPELYFGD